MQKVVFGQSRFRHYASRTLLITSINMGRNNLEVAACPA